MSDSTHLLQRRSFSELPARQRARELLDAGSFRELLDPFTRLESPWLAAQGIVPQSDDGSVNCLTRSPAWSRRGWRRRASSRNLMTVW